MKNLIPLIRKISYWDEIVRNKHIADRNHLVLLRPVVLSRIQLYSNHAAAGTMELIPASPYITPDKEILEGCYSTSSGLSTLKMRIRDRQPELLRGECQYCNIGEPDTFDHYLPQGLFSEFVALSVNLIPCCSTCNVHKGRTWLIAGQRKTLNLYYDPLPAVQFLNCSIIYRKNIVRAVFSVNTGGLPAGIRMVVDSHFRELLLVDRYQRKSNSEITEVFDAITKLAGHKTRIQIQAMLLSDATDLQVRRGTNYWRAIIRQALAASSRFLADAGF